MPTIETAVETAIETLVEPIDTSLTRPEFPSYARMFAAMHDAMRRDARRLVAAVDAPVPPRSTSRDGAALAEWFDRFEAVIEHHHRCEDEIVWPGLEAIIAAGSCGDIGAAFIEARQGLFEDHQELDAAMTAVRLSLHAPSAAIERSDAARWFEACLGAHLAAEEAAVFPLLLGHVSEDEFAVIEHAVVETSPFKSLMFTVPWVLDGAPADVIEIVADGLPIPIRLANRWVSQPRYRRLVAAATGERV
jgi:hypothetical protein